MNQEWKKQVVEEHTATLSSVLGGSGLLFGFTSLVGTGSIAGLFLGGGVGVVGGAVTWSGGQLVAAGNRRQWAEDMKQKLAWIDPQSPEARRVERSYVPRPGERWLCGDGAMQEGLSGVVRTHDPESPDQVQALRDAVAEVALLASEHARLEPYLDTQLLGDQLESHQEELRGKYKRRLARLTSEIEAIKKGDEKQRRRISEEATRQQLRYDIALLVEAFDRGATVREEGDTRSDIERQLAWRAASIAHSVVELRTSGSQELLDALTELKVLMDEAVVAFDASSNGITERGLVIQALYDQLKTRFPKEFTDLPADFRLSLLEPDSSNSHATHGVGGWPLLKRQIHNGGDLR